MTSLSIIFNLNSHRSGSGLFLSRWACVMTVMCIYQYCSQVAGLSTEQYKKSELMLMRCARACGSSCLQVIFAYLHLFQPFWHNSLLKCVAQPKIAKNSLKPLILGVQGHSRSSMLTFLRNSSPVLVMISSMSVFRKFFLSRICQIEFFPILPPQIDKMTPFCYFQNESQGSLKAPEYCKPR